MKRLLAALAIAALASGCMKFDKSPPKDMPAYVRIYPGAQPMMNMNLGVETSVVLTTADSPDQVVAYYRTQAASDGLTETAAPAPSGSPASQRQAAFADKATSRMLVVLARPGDASEKGATMIDLTYTTPAKAP